MTMAMTEDRDGDNLTHFPKTIALSHNLTHGCRKRCETLRSITCFHLHFVALLKDQIIGFLTTPHFEEGTSELLACKYFDIGRSASMDVVVQLCM